MRQLIVLFLSAVIGILISVTVNAQSTPSSKTRYIDDPGTSQMALNESIFFDSDVIQEMVQQHLSNTDQGLAIELAPLQITVNRNGHAVVKDVNPFLIAVAFGLEGKTIEITDPYAEFSEDLRQMMISRGVPANKIRINSNGVSANQWITNRLVSFRAL